MSTRRVVIVTLLSHRRSRCKATLVPCTPMFAISGAFAWVVGAGQGVIADTAAEEDRHGRDDQRHPHRHGYDRGCGRALLRHLGQDPNGEHRGRDRSGGQESGHAPVNVTPFGVDRGANRFVGGVEQVGSHRRERMDAEKQNQQRRHQSTATHAGQPHNGADDKAAERIEPVHGRDNSALVHLSRRRTGEVAWGCSKATGGGSSSCWTAVIRSPIAQIIAMAAHYGVAQVPHRDRRDGWSYPQCVALRPMVSCGNTRGGVQGA